MAGAVDGDFRAAGLDGWGWVSCFPEGIEEVWRGGDEVWKIKTARWSKVMGGTFLFFLRTTCNVVEA